MLLATLGGTPTIYAGDEYGLQATKEHRAGGDDAIRPEFPAAGGAALDDADLTTYRLHQQLLGLRRRHPWLHQATTSAIRLDNQHYIYQARAHDAAITVALNLADDHLPLQDLPGRRRPLLLSHPDPQHETSVLPAHGWAIYDTELRPDLPMCGRLKTDARRCLPRASTESSPACATSEPPSSRSRPDEAHAGREQPDEPGGEP